MRRTSAALLAIFCFSGGSAWAQSAPVIDNDRVTVWDIHLAKDAPAPKTPHALDCVIMFLEGGKIETTGADGKNTVATHAFGDALFVPKGSDLQLSGDGPHEIMIALKDGAGPRYENKSGYPTAFPRPGAVKALDNDRVTVWNYSWVPGQKTPMHFHDKDIVVAFRYDGTLKSVALDGTSTLNPYKAGEIRFNKGSLTHYEELTTERESAVMAELK